MSGHPTETDLVTGAFSYSGSRIAELLIESGREVRTLTHHPDREHPLRARVQASPYRFDDQAALARSLEGVTTLYNTYWVRFERGRTTFANAVANSRALFEAARRAGVARIVHVSIANSSIDSRSLLPLDESSAQRADPPCVVATPVGRGERGALLLLARPVIARPRKAVTRPLRRQVAASDEDQEPRPTASRVLLSQWTRERAVSRRGLLSFLQARRLGPGNAEASFHVREIAPKGSDSSLSPAPALQ